MEISLSLIIIILVIVIIVLAISKLTVSFISNGKTSSYTPSLTISTDIMNEIHSLTTPASSTTSTTSTISNPSTSSNMAILTPDNYMSNSLKQQLQTLQNKFYYDNCKYVPSSSS